MATASKQEMELLHASLAKVLKDAIEKYRDKDGNIVDAPASILNVARQFLKDNGIESAAVPSSPTGRLAAAFPFQAESDELDAPDTILPGVTK